MKTKLKKIKNRPQVLLSFFGSLIILLTIIMMLYLYNTKIKEILYEQMSNQVVTINKTKIHALSFFLDFRQSDIQALSSNETIINLSQKLKSSDKNYIEVGDLFNKTDKYLRRFLKEYMYTDAIIIDKEDGNILFSVNYEQYIGKNFNSKEFENTEMRRVWKRVIETKKTHFSDMHTPTLYEDEPVMLIATPILKDNEIISVLMLKMPSTLVNTVLHYSGSSMQSSETYAVGKDYLLRSDSSIEKDFTVKNSFMNVKKYMIKTKSVDKALSSLSGVHVTKDYRGVDVISAYTPFVFDSIRWVVITEIDEADVTKTLQEIEKTFYIWAVLISLVVFIMGFFVIKKVITISVINPLVELYDKAKGFEDIINNSLNEVYIFSKDEFYFIFANDTALKNTKYTLEELKKLQAFVLKPDYTKEKFIELLSPLLDGRKSIQIFETKHQRKDGTIYEAQVNLQLIEVDGVEKFVAIVNDVTEHNKVIKDKDYYYDLASHDHLTKIFNRQMFDEMYAKEIERSHRYGSSLSLIIIDIDYFKNVNDTYGHKAGDDVLVALAEHTQTLIRDSDVFARWGGEEFVILMPHSDIAKAAKKAEQIRASIEKLKIEPIGYITCSFGVAQFDNDKDNNEIFKQADKALYKAKENGRNRVESATVVLSEDR